MSFWLIMQCPVMTWKIKIKMQDKPVLIQLLHSTGYSIKTEWEQVYPAILFWVFMPREVKASFQCREFTVRKSGQSQILYQLWVISVIVMVKYSALHILHFIAKFWNYVVKLPEIVRHIQFFVFIRSYLSNKYLKLFSTGLVTKF